MNHRQWKKKFKKNHGRSPYWFEDKKAKKPPIEIDFAKMVEAIKAIPSALYNALAHAMRLMGDCFGHMAKDFENIASELEK